MTPYSFYIKQAQEPERPSYTSATETGGKAFQAPKYYDRPGINPELAAQGKNLEAEYGRMFPYGDYTYSSKGWGYRGGQRAQMNQQEIDLRNRFRLYEAQAMNAMPSNPQLLQQGPSAAGAFIGDLARSPIMPTAPAMYAYDVATKGFDQATQDKARSDAMYAGMLADAGKRVANRYGGNFELNYANDPLLDYSSYALEAAPSLLMMAATGGGSAAAQAGVQGTARAAAPSAFRAGGQLLARGFQPVMQGSTSRLAQFAGKAIPGGLNYAVSSINPVPLLTGAAQATGWGKPFAQLGAHLATRGAAQNYANAIRDTAAFNAANPELAGGPESAVRFGESLLANGVAFDPTALNKYGLGLYTVMPALAEQGQIAVDNAVKSIIPTLTPEQQNLVMSNPAQFEELKKQVATEFNNRNPSYPWIQDVAAATTFNPFRTLGAQSYSEDLAADRELGANVATGTIGLPTTALQDPRFYEDLQALQENPQAIGSSRLGQHLMASPMANLVGGSPENVVAATAMMANLNDMLSGMYQTYQQTGELPAGYPELVAHARNLAKMQELPPTPQESGNTPFVDALLQLQPTMNQVYQSMQPAQGAPQ